MSPSLCLLLLVAGGAELREPRVAPVAGVRATLVGQTLRFSKPDVSRRLVAVELVPAGDLAAQRSLSLRGRLVLADGMVARLALIAYEAGGGAWYRLDPIPVEPGAVARGLSLAGLQETAFSHDDDGALDWTAVERLWLGLVVEGAGDGVVEVESLDLSTEPYRPTVPLQVTGAWRTGQDPAVTSELTTRDEEGVEVMRYAFTMPLGSHMYALPQRALPAGDVSGYTHLRVTWRAALPPGSVRILISVHETGGAQYIVDPPPQPSAEWTTSEIPLDSLVLGGWSQDANQQLDLHQLVAVTVGCHGTAAEGGEGWIEAKEIAFVAR